MGNVKTITSNHPHFSFQVFASDFFYGFTLLSNTSYLAFFFFFSKMQSKNISLHELMEELVRAIYI